MTTGEILNKEHPWAPYVYGQSYTYCEAVRDAGGVPILLPFTHNERDISEMVDVLDGVLFAGGNDITPKFYQQEVTHSEQMSEARDEWEIELMQQVRARGLSTLAICRGMQLLNVSRGGSLHQDILKTVPGASSHRSSDEAKDSTFLAHTLKIKEGTKLARHVGSQEIRANSHHHQAVDKLGDALVVTAWAEDGIVEAIEDPSAEFVIGIQAHPESIYLRAEPKWEYLFKAFIEAAGKAG